MKPRCCICGHAINLQDITEDFAFDQGRWYCKTCMLRLDWVVKDKERR